MEKRCIPDWDVLEKLLIRMEQLLTQQREFLIGCGREKLQKAVTYRVKGVNDVILYIKQLQFIIIIKLK